MKRLGYSPRAIEALRSAYRSTYRKNLTIEEAKSFGLHLQVVERLINRSLLDQLLIDLKILGNNLLPNNSLSL